MVGFIHRQGDSRTCGATTKTRITNVRVNGKFISVDGDTNSHGGGNLKPSITSGKVRAGGEAVIIQGNSASADSFCPIPGGAHCNPAASSASPNVRAGGT